MASHWFSFSDFFSGLDIWAVGCIYAELLSLRPIFKGDEAKMDGKKSLPFQRDQMGKICEVLGPVKRMSFTFLSMLLLELIYLILFSRTMARYNSHA